MCEQIIHGRKCKVPSKNRLCHIHIKTASKKVDDTSERERQLKIKIENQSRELAAINTRLSNAQRKLQIIEYTDYIKYALAPIAIDCSFKAAIRNPANSKKISEIFGAHISQCEHIYDELLTKRNMIAHKYTSRNWSSKLKPPTHGKSVKKLISSIKTYELLRSPQA